MKLRSRSLWMFMAVLLFPGVTPLAAETFVLPAVVRGVPGMNGSFWESEVRILRMSLQQPFVVRRLWVATAEGGFVDDPATAPTWEWQGGFPGQTARLLVLRGADLLTGVAAASAAVAIETEGSALVYLRSTNNGAAPAGWEQQPITKGNGWLVPTTGTPLRGPSTIPWCTTGRGDIPEWFAYRTSVGFVNASTEPLDLRVSVVFLGGESWEPRFWLDSPMSTVPFGVVHLPPWGRVQLDDVFSTFVICTPIGCGTTYSEGPVLFIVEPLQDLAYFAYGSQIFSLLNDPEVVMAVPGLPEGIPYP